MSYHITLQVLVSVILCGKTFCGECDIKVTNTCETNGTTLLCKNFIPRTVPLTVITVMLECLGDSRQIDQETFAGNGWSSINNLHIVDFQQSGDLKFKNECFAGLKNLTLFRMWKGKEFPTVIFETNVFAGLKKLVTLDMRGLTFSHDAFVGSFNSNTNMPHIEELLLSQYGIQSLPFPLDDQVFNILKSRPIRKLELSYMDLYDLNFTAYEEFLANSSLEYFNISHTTLHNEKSKPVGQKFSVLNHLETLDATGFGLPLLSGVCKFVVNVSDKSGVPLSIDDGWGTFSRADTVIIDEFCPESTGTNYKEFRNITNLFLLTSYSWYWRKLSFNNNHLNIRVFDVEIICTEPSLEVISYTNNQLEYISSKALGCIHSLKDLNLSGNLLQKMNAEATKEFEKLFTALHKLENISLSSNNLESVPFNMFTNNTKVKRIDLSGNKLTQIHFNLSSLFHLDFLDVSSNQITQLDDLSRMKIDALFLVNLQNQGKRQLDLRGNPISCGKCSDLDSVKWLLSRQNDLKGFLEMTCTNEHNQIISVENSLVAHIQKLCDRPIFIRNTIVIGTSVLGTLLTISLVSFIAIRRRRRRRKREDRLRLIHEGQDEHEFLVFLSYSSDDCEIVYQNVFAPLSEKLKEFIDTERELICAGDKHFRAGHYIHNETIELLNRSAVALYVLSDNFTESNHCMNEFEEAYRMGKPIVLLTLGHLDINKMSTSMRELYNSRTRIIFAKESNAYVLQTTWQNVCESILAVMH